MRPALAVLAAVLLASPARAQSSNEMPSSPPFPPVRGAPPPAAPADDSPPPYEPQLERLAELMGTLAYLRDLCGKGDGEDWRRRMAALLDAEAKSEARRDRLAGAYNFGFQGYQVTYRTCTPAAEVVISRSIVEGDRLAQDLSTRFGGG